MRGSGEPRPPQEASREGRGSRQRAVVLIDPRGRKRGDAPPSPGAGLPSAPGAELFPTSTCGVVKQAGGI